MIVNKFSENCTLYDGFQVWEIESISDFFKGNEVLTSIFKDEYKFQVGELHERRNDISDTDFDIMKNLLELVGDKSFYMFTLHDENHLELVGMQKMNIMNFGIDIENIKSDHVYVMIMDKKNSKAFTA